METITIEVHPRTAEELAQEASERGYRNRSEYVRQLVLHRSVITSGPPVANKDLADEQVDTTTPASLDTEDRGELEAVEARVDAQLNELKQRVIALESELETQADRRNAADDD